MPIILETVNSLLESGTFPSCLGQATVTPVLKKQSLNKDSLCNYRPISNIRFLAKVLEKVVAHQLHEYIDLNHLDNPRQSAYKKNYSTETALLSLQNDISRALDDKKATFLLSLDLSAAFDTLDHAILTERLHTHFGLSGFALQWFVSYLQNRTCSVAIDNSDSPQVKLEYGVPQGSVLGPLLFTLYLQPIANIFQEHNINYHMYADDIQIYLTCDPGSQDSIQGALSKLIHVVRDIQTWMTVNKLKLNQDKTEFLVVASQAHHQKLTDVKLTLGDVVLEPSQSLRILGVIFDDRLLHDAQVANISRTVKFHLRNLTLIRKYLDASCTHAAIRALVLSRLDYCNSLLYGTSTKNLHSLQLLQNQAARLIYMKPKYTHTSPLIQTLHWLPVLQRIEYKNAVLTYKSLSNQASTWATVSTPASLCII
jgi:hypothetical protein